MFKIKLFLSQFIPIKSLRRQIKANLLWREEHPKVGKFLDEKYILSFIQGALPNFEFKPKANFKDDKIIWQLWYQGEQNAPELVKMCLSSVKKHMGQEYQVIVLDENLIKHYLDFPPFIWQKIENKAFGEKTISIFSDLLRVALLATYGGVWLDASIFLSDKIPDKLLQKDFFVFQRSLIAPENHKEWTTFDYRYFVWDENFRAKFFSAFIISKSNYPLINALRDILMNFWQNENSLPHYFIFNFIFDSLIQNESYKSLNCEITNDTDIHLLQLYVKKGLLNEKTWQEIKQKSFLHKLNTHLNGLNLNFL